MKCKVCQKECGDYKFCWECNKKIQAGELIRCSDCGCWHQRDEACYSDPEDFVYTLKQYLITKTEKSFFIALKEAVPEGFEVYPQVNLAAFVCKTNHDPYRPELFRNVDFLITDEFHQPKIAVEINDDSHEKKERRERDIKVRKICEEAGIPLIALWTSYGVRLDYIKQRIDEALATPPQRIHHYGRAVNQQFGNTDKEKARQASAQNIPRNKKGCYVATCVYGSYDCPEVWVLRRYRDKALATTRMGRLFIRVYYGVSPYIVKFLGESSWFKGLCRRPLDALVKRLRQQGFNDTPYRDMNL